MVVSGSEPVCLKDYRRLLLLLKSLFAGNHPPGRRLEATYREVMRPPVQNVVEHPARMAPAGRPTTRRVGSKATPIEIAEMTGTSVSCIA
jgi:hypothetical protein